MANPKKYVPSYSFSGFQASNPKTPLPAPRLDDELANISQSVGGLVDGLGQIRRSDGKLANAVVDLAALSDEVIHELGGAGAGSGGDGVIFATQAQAEAGTSAAVVMSPLRVRQAIATFAGDGGGGTTPGGPIDIDDVAGLSDALAGKSPTGHTHAMSAVSGLADALAGKQAALGFAPEDRTNRGQAGGYASLGSDGKVPAAQLPAAQAVASGTPVVYLTDGSDPANPPADWTATAKANLARAVAERKPFIVPPGRFALTEALVVDLSASDAPLTIWGYGKRASELVWQIGAASSGLRITSPNSHQAIQIENVGFVQRAKNTGTAVSVDFVGQVIPNNGNPVTMNRCDPRGHLRSCYVGGDGNPFQQGWQYGLDVNAPVAFQVYDNDFWGTLQGGDPNYTSEIAIRLGADNGYGHPVECYVERNRVFHFKKAVEYEGMEGAYCLFNQLVGVNIGIHFKDTEGRPQLIAVGNHINMAGVGILVENCYQFTLIGNLIYLVTNANMTATGILVRGANSGCGQIVSNQFENTDTTYSASHLNCVIVENGRDIVIDHNVYRRSIAATIAGVWLTSGSFGCTVGAGEVFNTAGGEPTYRIQDNGTRNMIPGRGLRYQRNGNVPISGGQLNIIPFDALMEVTGNPGDGLEDGVFIVPEDGLWCFTAGVQLATNGNEGGVVLNLQKNATSNAAMASQAATFAANDPRALSVTSGPRMMKRNDQVRVGCNPAYSTTVVVNSATFFEARRLA